MSRQTGKAEEECPHKQDMLRANVLSMSTAAAQAPLLAPWCPFRPQRIHSGSEVLAVGSEDTVSSSKCPKYGGVRSRLRQLQASHGTNSDATTNRNAKPRRVPGRILGALK